MHIYLNLSRAYIAYENYQINENNVDANLDASDYVSSSNDHSSKMLTSQNPEFISCVVIAIWTIGDNFSPRVAVTFVCVYF